jgi:hypothetical protein
VFPARGIEDIGFAGAQVDPDPDELDRAAVRIRDVLRQHGHAAMVPAEH